MGKKLVRQFKTHNAPAGSRGYRSQATVEYPPLNPPAAVVDYGVPSIDHGVRQRPPAPPTPPVVDLSMIPEIPMLVPYPPTAAQIPRTMGTPALPPDWYPETPNRIWSPQQQPTTNPRLRRNTGEGDLPINVPRVNLPTTTLPPQRPTSPYTQPNVGVDITPEQFTLPPQQQQIIRERPTTIDYGPITTPIERPIQEDAGYIEPQQLYPLTPGPQITATEQSFYEPQPVEGAYAYPVQADYPQPQPLNQNPDLNQDEITNLIDTLIPEQQEAKTIQMHEEGPQWVEDPYALAAQEAIDQAPFNQTDPSIYSPAETSTIAEAPEIQIQATAEKLSLWREPPKFFGEGVLGGAEEQATGGIGVYGGQDLEVGGETHSRSPYRDTTDQDRGWFDVIQEGYPEDSVSPVDLIGATPTTDPSRLFSPDTRLTELPITQPPELGMPEIPTAQVAGGTVAGIENLPPAGGPNDLIFKDQEGDMVTNLENVESGPFGWVRPGPVDIPEGATVIPDSAITDVATDATIPAKTITPEGIVIDDSGKTYTIDTSAGVDIEQLPEASITGEVAEGPLIDPPLKDFTPEIADPPAPVIVEDGIDVEVDQGDKVDPNVQQKALTTTGTGGRKWVHTGPADFAETLHQFKINRGSSGPPIVTDTPAVSGPVVNRETGEITREPLTWHQFNPAGSSVSPYTEGISTGTDTGTGAKGQPDVTGVSATSGTGRGGEGKTPFQTFLEGQDTAGSLIPGGLNIDMASLKGQAGINQLRSEMTAKDFEGIDSFEGLGNFFNLKPAFQGFGESIAGAIQELTGMEAGDLKGPGLWDTLNTPIPAFSTDEFGITPLDIITVIASGTVAIGPILVKKFMDSLMQPFEAAVTDGLKGVFNTIFKRGGDAENYNEQPVSQENINAADLEVLAEELGIDKPSGMIEAGTYYGADGVVIARNMKPLDFGLNTVDGANSFKDVLHAVGTKVDPGYTSIKYNTQTGQTDVVHADGSVTENASHITIDSEGNMQQGTGNSKKTKKVNWGVKVIGVNAIDTVAPRKDKGKGKGKGGSIWDWIKGNLPGKDDEEEEETKPPAGN